MQKGSQSKIWMQPHLYQRTLSLPVMSGYSYLDTQQWVWLPLYQCSFSKGGHERFYHSKRGNGKVVFTFSKESVTGGADHKMYHLQIYVVVWTPALALDPGPASTSLKEQLHIGIGKRKFGGILWKKLTIYLECTHPAYKLPLWMPYPAYISTKSLLEIPLILTVKNLNNTIYRFLPNLEYQPSYIFLLSLYHHQKQCHFII